MAPERLAELQALEGRTICLALRHGSRIDDCVLISAGRQGVSTLWVWNLGADEFVPRADVVDFWETRRCQPRLAA